MENKLRCYIIDDEERAINSLKYLLDYYCHEAIQVAGASSIYEEAVAYLENNVPDVIFLDINLGKETGFNLLKRLGSLPHTDIIIVTAYSEYALEAFSYGTVDYLLKPVNPDALQKTIHRIESRKRTKNIIQFIPKEQTEHLFYPTRDGYKSLNYKNIVCIKGDGSYVNVYLTDNSSFIVSKNLSFFEQLLLSRSEFIRVHKSYIINKAHIKELNKKGGIKLIMTGDIHIPISITMRQIVMNVIGY